MIYYFTGTGNSLYVAQRLAALTGTGVASIAEMMNGKPLSEPEEISGIVYPIYAWGPPKMVIDFLKQHPIKSDYVFSVCTCGEDAGHAMKKIEKAMGRALDCAYSIVMPNNYIIGMDIDSEEEAARMIKAADERVLAIAENINVRRRRIYDVTEGAIAGLKTGLVSPLFNTFATSAKPFYAEDTCTGCKRCEGVCPTRNIRVDNKPRWGNNCTGCLACLHHCPVAAIQRGKGTKGKGRYINPNCRVEYDFG